MIVHEYMQTAPVWDYDLVKKNYRLNKAKSIL